MLDLEKIAETKELFDGHYRLLYPLSTDGATADIWLAVDTNTVDDDELENVDEEQGLKVAIKVYRPQNALDIEGIQRFRNEFKVVFNCQHSNLLHPVHYSIYKETPYLVLPYCQNGSTELLIGKLRDNDDIWKFIYDVASGLEYLHYNHPQIIHQDIKPANILIDNNQNYTITDFGISISRNQHLSDIEENYGTFAYMAPERFLDRNRPIPESDIWAFGATLFELITGNVPFGEDGGMIQLSGNKIEFPSNCSVSKDIKKIINACLCKDYGQRPTAHQLVEYARLRRFPRAINWKSYLYVMISVFLLSVFSFVIIYGLEHKMILSIDEAGTLFTNNPSIQDDTSKSLKITANTTDVSLTSNEHDSQKQTEREPIIIHKTIRKDGKAYVTRITNNVNYKVKVVLEEDNKRFSTELEPGQLSTPNFVCKAIRCYSYKGSKTIWSKNSSTNAGKSNSSIPIIVQMDLESDGRAFVSSIKNVSNSEVNVRIYVDEKSILYTIDPSDIVSPSRFCTGISYETIDGWNTYWEKIL